MKMKLFAPLAWAVCSVVLVSCDKVEDVFDEAKKFVKEHTGENSSASEEDIRRSDAAVAKYIEEVETIPAIMAKVINEETAFKARAEIDEISRRVVDLREELVPISNDGKKKLLTAKTNSNGPKSGNSGAEETRNNIDLEGEVYWYILEENTEEYNNRVQKVVRRIVAQIFRIEASTRDSPVALNVVVDGILTLANVENGGKAPGEVPDDLVQPMKKDWLPPGVTRETSDDLKFPTK